MNKTPKTEIDEAISDLFKVASKLLTAGPSPFKDDHPKGTTNKMIRQFERNREANLEMARKIKSSIDQIRKVQVENIKEIQ